MYTYLLLAGGVAAVTSITAIAILSRLAEHLGLVDSPSGRKHHDGHIPLIGGLAIFAGLVVSAMYLGDFHAFSRALLGSAAMLAVVGALDDRHDLSVRVRLLTQITAIAIVIAVSGVYLHTLGKLFGYQLELGFLGMPITVVAVVGLLNAFNMMDGIDGLAGGLALISIATIVMFTGITPLHASLALMALLACAILPYLLANLGLMGRKIFMGDAGSMVIGYLLAWTLIRLSQEPARHLSPVDALWCVALPVLDTFAVIYRRLRQGKSPFKPDRGHIHHILLDAGIGARGALLALIALAGSLAFVGSVVRSLAVGSGSNLAAFCIVAGIYIVTVTRVRVRQEARKMRTTGNSQQASRTDKVMSIQCKHQTSSHAEHKASERAQALKAANSSE